MIFRAQKSTMLFPLLLLAGTAFGQAAQEPSVTYTPIAPPTSAPSGRTPSVSIAPVPLVTAPRAARTMVNLNFRVATGFHINSNAPKDEFLIPTALKMDLPTDIILGKIEYPEGKDLSLPFFAGAEAERVQRRLYDCGGRASAARGHAGKIRDARCAALPGLRQRAVLSAENAAREFRRESGEGAARPAPQSGAEPARA